MRSAGNGAAMRCAIIGVYFYDTPNRRRKYVDACSRVTHVDVRSIEAAQLVAEAAALAAVRADQKTILERLYELIESTEMGERFSQLKNYLTNGDSVEIYAQNIGSAKKVSGFAPDSVAMALFSWLRHRHDFQKTIIELVRCGGDTDTVAAIAGAIAGVEYDRSSYPQSWVDRLRDWPITTSHLKQLAKSLSKADSNIPRIHWPLALVRNIGFLLIVIAHIIRRCLPPY